LLTNLLILNWLVVISKLLETKY